MTKYSTTTIIERFQVTGNVLKVTPRFDPRYQTRAAGELISIVSSLAEDGEGTEVVLDISASSAMPSIMIGMLCTARDLADRAGKRLKIRLKQDTYQRLRELGLGAMFSRPDAENARNDQGDQGGHIELEMAGDALPPVMDQEEKGSHGS